MYIPPFVGIYTCTLHMVGEYYISYLPPWLDVYDNNPYLSPVTQRIENLLGLIAFTLFLVWDMDYVLIACLSSESH